MTSRATHITGSLLRLAALPAVLGLLALAALPSSASALQTHLYDQDFGSANQPTFAGDLRSLVVIQDTGEVLLIDSAAQSITRWNPNGTPSDFPALGTNVIDGAGGGDCPATPADCDQTPTNGLALGTNSSMLAVDQSGTATDGNIYVTQNPAAGASIHAVEVFGADGGYLGSLDAAGATPFASGGLSDKPLGVAVDSSGDLYVSGGNAKEIYKFDPAATIPVPGDHIDTFPVAADYDPPGGDGARALAAGAGPSAGSLFVVRGLQPAFKLDASSGASEYELKFTTRTFEQFLIRDLAVDPSSGNLYLVRSINNDLVNGRRVEEWDASGSAPNPVSQFVSPAAGGGDHYTGVAVHGASGKVYVSHQGSATLEEFSPLITVPDALTDSATITGLDSATLNGTVNPDGEPLTSCRFEYLTNAAYQSNLPVNRFAGATQVLCSQAADEIGAGSAPVSVSAAISDLATPGVTYRYRLVASNINASTYPDDPNAIGKGAAETLRTPDAPTVDDSWASMVGTNAASVSADISPNNAETTYRVEYGTEGPCSDPNNSCQSAPDPEAPAGGDDTVHTIVFELVGLKHDTTHHYRVVATNPLGSSEGVDQTFRTYPPAPAGEAGCLNQALRLGPAEFLPECRAYEMVSPVEKNSADISAGLSISSFEQMVVQASPNGSKLAYSSRTSFGEAKGSAFSSQYIGTRDQREGWQTEPITPPRDTNITSTAADYLVNQFVGFTEDLSYAWLSWDGDPPLDPAAPSGVKLVYRRDNSSGEFSPLTTVTPSGPNSRLGTLLQGFAADGQSAAFTASARLVPAASGSAERQLYEYRAGEALRLVSVLPNGEASDESSMAGSSQSTGLAGAGNAVSEDGSVIWWTTDGHLYARINGIETVAISESVSAATASLQFAAADGSAAYFRIGGDLYHFDLDAALASEPDPATLVASGVSGVIGAADDLSGAYLVSSDVLDSAPNSEGDVASNGDSNIFHYRQGEGFSFVGALAGSIEVDNGAQHLGVANSFVFARASRVSPDGRHLVFVSRASLTGHDNANANGGAPVTQVYRHSAESGELSCVSCNPTGARPDGQVGRVQPLRGPPTPRNVSGLIRAHENADQTNSFHARRVLSEDGNRVFFESYDQLLPRDTNSQMDVYLWQAPGTSDCDTDNSNPGPLYFETNGGCLSLISSGESGAPADFIDATPDGETVFFRTDSSLLPQDPGLLDIYAAKVNGGFPPQPPAPPGCVGEECRGDSPASPPDQGAGTEAFEGAGNPAPDEGAVGLGPAQRCRALARRAGKLSQSARGLMQRARGMNRVARRSASSPARARAARRQAARLTQAARARATQARRSARAAQRCRAQIRQMSSNRGVNR